jgi:hypothetical protein
MGGIISPGAFFAGLLAGLLGLSWLGSVVESRHLAAQYVRAYQGLNPESGYHFTGRQVRTLTEAAAAKAEVVIVVGGTSVFAGAGHPTRELWSRGLQAELGPRYRVINLAQLAGNANDFGNIAAELLLLQNRPVIYLADGWAEHFTIPIPSSRYRDTLVDAWHRGLLLPWTPRDEVLQSALLSRALRPAALASMLDRYLHFKDLWNFVAYDHVNTILNPYTFFVGPVGGAWFRPRRLYSDVVATGPRQRPVRVAPAPATDPAAPEAPNAAPAANATPAPDPNAPPPALVAMIRERYDPDQASGLARTNQTIPPRLRAVTLAVINLLNPGFHPPGGRQGEMNFARSQIRGLEGMGFYKAVVVAEDFDEEDYIDRGHLRPSGGQKLVERLAPLVRAMATDLGYLR